MRSCEFLFFLGIAALGSGCGSDDDTETTPPPPDAGDGRYYPPANGVHTTQDAACQALATAQETKRTMLGCVATTRMCPELLTFEFVTPCLEYDQGSVQGCVDHYNKQTTCTDYKAAVKDCVVTAYPGTEPAGCP